jgi:predicted AAA+ superfamily ATPase
LRCPMDGITASTLENYISFLEKSNLIYRAQPMDVGNKGALKGRPKIYIADAAIRSAVLMMDDVLADEKEMGIMVETTVYKQIVSFYQGISAYRLFQKA